MAYRTADHERWQQLDFVIGIEILLSNNHPCEDICDELAGVYPKTFKSVGWHPFCRCIAVPKLADEDEFIARQQALIDGQDAPEGDYSGEVTELPSNFTDWVQNNAERIENAKSVPYFIRDNVAVIDNILNSDTLTPATRSIKDLVARHGVSPPETIADVVKSHELRESPKIEKGLNTVRKSLIRQNREVMMILDKNGKPIQSGSGAPQSVHFDEETAALMKNRVVTHNYPTCKNATGALSFGYSLSFGIETFHRVGVSVQKTNAIIIERGIGFVSQFQSAHQ